MTAQNLTPTNSTSPLAETNPQTLEELFNRDPLSLSDQDIDVIVVALRKQYASFALEDKKAKATGTRVKTKKAKAQLSEDVSTLLEELEL